MRDATDARRAFFKTAAATAVFPAVPTVQAAGTRPMVWPRLPAYDHIVIVVLENCSAYAGGSRRVWDNPQAPVLNALASDPKWGVRFANAWASETPYRRVPQGFERPLSARPSQPNYLYLFSGSHQGVVPSWFEDPRSPYTGKALMDAQGNRLKERRDDVRVGVGNHLVPAAWRPFATANLGASLLQAGKTFATFSESMPHPEWDEEGDFLAIQDMYRRKHNPAINWVDFGPSKTSASVPPERRRFVLPRSVNLAFEPSMDPQGKRWRGFDRDAQGRPLGFDQLPTVSLVVPNEQNDAHSAPLARADEWLGRHILPYAEWARTHNSLLIVTFDEDGSTDGSQGDPYRHGRDRVATLFHGAGLKPGVYDERIDALNVLATVLHSQGLLDRFRADFAQTCPEPADVRERELANLRPILDVFGAGGALDEQAPVADRAMAFGATHG